MAKLLIVDDDANMRWALEKALGKDGHHILTAENGVAAEKIVQEGAPDLMLCDLKMPGMDGMSLLTRLKKDHPSLPVIMITGFGTVEDAVQAMKLGAADFILKPFDIEAVKLSVRKALGIERLKEEVRFWREEAWKGLASVGIVGSSPLMRQVLNLVQQVAPTNATVLITGESGTGKELIAQAIHQNSPRSDQPLIKVNCAAIPETLLESELFGHEKGAFTGAVTRRLGRFERADQGTIFLDEIGEITPTMQIKLLRVLQEREFERVGGTETIKVDVRIVAATNRDLASEVKNGGFREDLYYRLKVLPIEIPPLRERKSDIPELVDYFLKKFAPELGRGGIKVEPETMELLTRYHWPGNVRELQNVLERALILCAGESIIPEQLPIEVLRPDGQENVSADDKIYNGDNTLFRIPDEGLNLESMEKNLIRQALDRSEGNQSKAARLLGISRYTLIYRMEKYGMR